MPPDRPIDTGRRLRVLVVTKLFPNAAAPMQAVYNRLQFVPLSRLCELDVRAVVPWFPGASLFGRWSAAGRSTGLPAEEVVDGLLVRHPRVLFVPKVGAALSPALYLASLWPSLRHLRGRVDVVLGCWAYPDGIAAIWLAERLGAASVVKVHGSDLNVLARLPPLRRIMSRVLPRVGRLVAVSRPLAREAAGLGVAEERIELVANGLDREHFRPRDRVAARAELGLPPTGRLVLFVGLMHRTKGLLDLLQAFERLAPLHPDLRLALVGDGPDAGLARQTADRLSGRVFRPGVLPPEGVARWISACDLLTLPSWNEGTPNVILEAFASGRRVVATSVGGIPDVVTSPELGELVPVKDVVALADAIARGAYQDYQQSPLIEAAPHRWAESAAHLHRVLAAAAAEADERHHPGLRSASMKLGSRMDGD